MKTIDTALQKEIVSINAHMERILHSDNAKMQEIMEWVLQSKGKQLRPKLVCLCSKFGKGKADATKMAAMMEIIHMASLVHDDVIDNADTRRGYLSVQKKFGKHMAVYAGDYMIFCIVQDVMNDKDYKKYSSLYTIVQKMCYGEIGQDSSMYHPDVTEEEYISNITGKTAVLFESSCELGALTTKAAPKAVDALKNYGKNLGLLFQIRDDLLDYQSSEDDIGKPILQDMVNGIYTLPIIYALQNEESKEKLLGIIGQVNEKGLDTDTAQEIIKLVNESKGMERTREKAKEFYESAVASLDTLVDIKEKEYLLAILDRVYQDI